jgi:hypothetical protein
MTELDDVFVRRSITLGSVAHNLGERTKAPSPTFHEHRSYRLDYKRGRRWLSWNSLGASLMGHDDRALKPSGCCLWAGHRHRPGSTLSSIGDMYRRLGNGYLEDSLQIL